MQNRTITENKSSFKTSPTISRQVKWTLYTQHIHAFLTHSYVKEEFFLSVFPLVKEDSEIKLSKLKLCESCTPCLGLCGSVKRKDVAFTAEKTN